MTGLGTGSTRGLRGLSSSFDGCDAELETLLAYGRFRAEDDLAEARSLMERALDLFVEIDATGWIDEARAALG